MFLRLNASLWLAVILSLGSLSPAAASENPPGKRQQAANSMLTDIEQATWIRDGQSSRVMYVFFDPNCPYCHKVFQMLRAPVERGEVEVRWIPVGYLMTTSLGKAAAILEDKDPTDALYRNERGFSRETGSFGGILEEPLPDEKTIARLQRNKKLLELGGQAAVPAILYRNKDGKPNLVHGAPPESVVQKIVKEL